MILVNWSIWKLLALTGALSVRKQKIHQTLPSNFQQSDKVDDKGFERLLEDYVTSRLDQKPCQILSQPAPRWTVRAVIVEIVGVVEAGHILIKKFTLSEKIKTLLVTFSHLCDSSKRWKIPNLQENMMFAKYNVEVLTLQKIDCMCHFSNFSKKPSDKYPSNRFNKTHTTDSWK